MSEPYNTTSVASSQEAERMSEFITFSRLGASRLDHYGGGDSEVNTLLGSEYAGLRKTNHVQDRNLYAIIGDEDQIFERYEKAYLLGDTGNGEGLATRGWNLNRNNGDDPVTITAHSVQRAETTNGIWKTKFSDDNGFALNRFGLEQYGSLTFEITDANKEITNFSFDAHVVRDYSNLQTTTFAFDTDGVIAKREGRDKVYDGKLEVEIAVGSNVKVDFENEAFLVTKNDVTVNLAGPDQDPVLRENVLRFIQNAKDEQGGVDTVTVGRTDGAQVTLKDVTIGQAMVDTANSGPLGSVPLPETPGPERIGEVGTFEMQRMQGVGEHHVVTFDTEFDQGKIPVVVMGPASTNGAQPVTMRVFDVTSTGFKFEVEEWEYLDGAHIAENISWMAVEQGVHTLTDGRVLEAGVIGELSLNLDDGTPGRDNNGLRQDWETVEFDGDFAGGPGPIVFSQVSTYNGANTVTTRHQNVDTTRFEITLQEEEAQDNYHAKEQVGWIAMETGFASDPGLAAGVTGDDVTHDEFQFSFGADFDPNTDVGGVTPAFFAQMQSFDGADTATVRYTELTDTGATIFIEEEQSRESEVRHTTETVGWAAFAEGNILATAPPTLPFMVETPAFDDVV